MPLLPEKADRNLAIVGARKKLEEERADYQSVLSGVRTELDATAIELGNTRAVLRDILLRVGWLISGGYSDADRRRLEAFITKS